MRKKSITLVFISCFVSLWALQGCLEQDKKDEDSKSPEPVVPTTITNIRTETFTLVDKTYDLDLLKYESSNLKSYWQFVKSQARSRGTIIYSVPYEGADWIDDPIDQRWSEDPRALTGYLGDDVDGPDYNQESSKQVSYRRIPSQDMPVVGFDFSYNDYNVLYVYHRFYAGRYADDYVNEMVEAINWVRQQEPESEIGLYGGSLGGYIVSHASSKFTSNDIAAMVLVSPLLSWPMQESFLDSLLNLISTATVLQGYQDFFEPYTRRFTSVESSGRDVVKTSIPTLIIHDEWDTLVPIEQADKFVQDRNKSKIFLKYYHNSPINFETMVRDHAQPGSGMTGANIRPFYTAFFNNRIGENTEFKYIFYTESAADAMFVEMYTMKGLGKVMKGFQDSLGELCKDHFVMSELNQARGGEIGPTYIARKLNEVWGTSLNSTNVCDYLGTNDL